MNCASMTLAFSNEFYVEISMYQYVGSNAIRASVSGFPIGTRIQSIDDLKSWIDEAEQQPDARGLIPATFVVDADCYLRIADRHSEHIACAGVRR
jgi:hypothetical protein